MHYSAATAGSAEQVQPLARRSVVLPAEPSQLIASALRWLISSWCAEQHGHTCKQSVCMRTCTSSRQACACSVHSAWQGPLKSNLDPHTCQYPVLAVRPVPGRSCSRPGALLQRVSHLLPSEGSPTALQPAQHSSWTWPAGQAPSHLMLSGCCCSGASQDLDTGRGLGLMPEAACRRHVGKLLAATPKVSCSPLTGLKALSDALTQWHVSG